jgi:hypothetical protein
MGSGASSAVTEAGSPAVDRQQPLPSGCKSLATKRRLRSSGLAQFAGLECLLKRGELGSLSVHRLALQGTRRNGGLTL